MPKVKLLWHAGPEEKNEYAYENEYEKKHDFMCIFVPNLVNPPPKKWGEEQRCYRSVVGCVLWSR